MIIHAGIILKKVIFALVIIQVSAEASITSDESSDLQNGICLTPSCIHAASNILKNINFSANPCTDFYKFSCGGFEESTDIHDTGNGIDNFKIIQMKIWNQAKRSLEKKITPNDSKSMKLAKNLYKSCIKPSKFDQFHEVFNEIGGIPIIKGNDWESTDFFWRDLSQEMHRIGFFGDLFQIEIQEDIKNDTRRIIQLSTPVIFADNKEETFDIFHSRWVKTIIDLSQNRDVNWTSVAQDIDDLFNFMINLDNIIDRNEHYYNPMTISDLNNRYSFPWKEYLNRILQPLEIDDEELINVQSPSYLGNLSELLSETQPRTQANFMLWRHVVNSLNYIQRDGKNSWEQCINLVMEKFPNSLISLYERDYFNDKVKNEVTQLTDAIHNEFINTLEKRNWNSPFTKNATINDAKSMNFRLSYRESSINDSELDKGYKNVNLVNDNFLQNMLSINIYKKKLSYKTFREPIVKNILKSDPYHGLRSFLKYNNETNTIVLPPGNFQGSIFDGERPKYMNFGALGSFIGHEMTHMIKSDNEIILKSEICIENNYNERVVFKDYKVNGRQTLMENIADIGGTQLAYSAYENWMKLNDNESKLPGLPYSPRQLFWISYANMFCSRYREDQLLGMLIYDNHSPPSARVIGSLSNSKDFREDFGCPESSKMYQKKICTVW